MLIRYMTPLRNGKNEILTDCLASKDSSNIFCSFSKLINKLWGTFVLLENIVQVTKVVLSKISHMTSAFMVFLWTDT